MKNPVLEIDHLTLTLSNKNILQNVSFKIYEGDYLSIIGPNGAGKTSLLKCLMGIYAFSEGEIKIRGEGIKKISQRFLAKQISYVPQTDGRYFPFTVSEFVLMGRYPHLSPFTSYRTQDINAVKHAMQLTKIQHLSERQINTLSGGEKQTVFVAAALAQGANILLLDEPTTFLDPKHEEEIYSVLKRINNELGITIISVTHDINGAVLNGQRIVVLKDGKVKYDGEVMNIMDNKILSSVYEKDFVFTNHPLTGQRIIAPGVPQR